MFTCFILELVPHRFEAEVLHILLQVLKCLHLNISRFTMIKSFR